MLECFIAFIAVIADQLTKIWVVNTLAAEGAMTVIPGVLDFRYVKNTGAAFGMFGNMTIVLTIFSVIVAIVLAFLLWKYRRTESILFRVSAAMIIGGAIGNLIDRIAIGYVVDFIEFTFVNFAVFNVADCFVTVGTIMLAVYLVFFYEKNKKRRLAMADISAKNTAGTVDIEAGDISQSIDGDVKDNDEKND